MTSADEQGTAEAPDPRWDAARRAAEQARAAAARREGERLWAVQARRERMRDGATPDTVVPFTPVTPQERPDDEDEGPSGPDAPPGPGTDGPPGTSGGGGSPGPSTPDGPASSDNTAGSDDTRRFDDGTGAVRTQGGEDHPGDAGPTGKTEGPGDAQSVVDLRGQDGDQPPARVAKSPDVTRFDDTDERSITERFEELYRVIATPLPPTSTPSPSGWPRPKQNGTGPH